MKQGLPRIGETRPALGPAIGVERKTIVAETNRERYFFNFWWLEKSILSEPMMPSHHVLRAVGEALFTQQQ